IALYRSAWRRHGHDGHGHVVLMVHAFIGEDLDIVRQRVRAPFINYLKQSLDLGLLGQQLFGADASSAVSADDMEVLLSRAFDRHVTTSALIGTPESCLPLVEQLREIGVDELACLIDFGLDEPSVMAGLEGLNRLRITSRARPSSTTIANQVTHLQCTPSGALLLDEVDDGSVLKELQTLLVGGEPLAPAVGARLRRRVNGRVCNMYGPTETTVWSAMHELTGEPGNVPIGRPIANTQLYVLDA